MSQCSAEPTITPRARIVEYAAKAWAPTNAPHEVCRWCAVDQRIVNPLMIPLPVIMLDVLRDHPAQMTLAERRLGYQRHASRFQDPGDRRPADLMAQVLQRAKDPRVTPCGILSAIRSTRR